MGGSKQASWRFTPGTEIGNERVAVRLLGGGERFEAWLGWDDHLFATVVLKLLRPDQADDPKARAAIAREAAILRGLSHPGIVRCFGADLDGERPYLVLEFLDGPRLSTLLRRYGPLTHEQLVPLATEMGSALAYLHNEQQVHLDVKPQNLIMGAPPRLIDLSIARRFDEIHRLKGALGTDSYMAPEQCDPSLLHTIGPATDVWGLGATLYEAANGHRPFRKRQSDGPYPQLTDEPSDFHPRVPKALRTAIARCLIKDPAERPTIPELMEVFDPMVDDARDVALTRLRRRIRW